MKILKVACGFVGSLVVSVIRTLLVIGFIIGGAASANYLMTVPGSGTSFASVVISTVHYAAGLICDATNGQANCSAVKAGNTAAVGDQALVVSDPNVLAAVTTPPTLGSASGGWTPVAKNAIAGTAVAVLAAGAHQMGFALCDNNNAAWTYLQFIDSAAPTVGTNVGFLPIPPNTNTGFALALVGIQFSTQMQVAATTTPNGTTAPGTAINCTFGTH